MDDEREIRVQDRVIGRYLVSPDMELHFRRRTVEGLPPTLDLAQFNKQGGGYRLATYFPDDPRLLRSLIRGMTRHLEQEHGEGVA